MGDDWRGKEQRKRTKNTRCGRYGYTGTHMRRNSNSSSNQPAAAVLCGPQAALSVATRPSPSVSLSVSSTMPTTYWRHKAGHE